MHRVSRLVLLSAAFILSAGAGCGSPAVEDPPVPGPHGAVAVPLPPGRGYAEVTVERAKAARGQTPAVEFVVYFLQSDAKAPLAPLPTDVVAKLLLPEGEPVTVPLSPHPRPREPAGAGRYASAPGPFDFDELQGELTATLDGQPVTVPFSFR